MPVLLLNPSTHQNSCKVSSLGQVNIYTYILHRILTRYSSHMSQTDLKRIISMLVFLLVRRIQHFEELTFLYLGFLEAINILFLDIWCVF